MILRESFRMKLIYCGDFDIDRDYLKSIYLSIAPTDAPTVSLITPTQLSVIEGENVTIGCIPDGNPLPKVVIYYFEYNSTTQ